MRKAAPVVMTRAVCFYSLITKLKSKKMKLPQIITDNLNDRIVDQFFCLIKLVS